MLLTVPSHIQDSLCMDGWMDGWMTCRFASFPAIFQLYEDAVKMIMKGCMHHREPCLRLGGVPVSMGFEPRAARAVGQRLTC